MSEIETGLLLNQHEFANISLHEGVKLHFQSRVNIYFFPQDFGSMAESLPDQLYIISFPNNDTVHIMLVVTLLKYVFSFLHEWYFILVE